MRVNPKFFIVFKRIQAKKILIEVIVLSTQQSTS